MHNDDVRDKETFLSMSQAYLDENSYKEALDLAESWIKMHPMDADANIVCCHALMRMGKLDRVEKVLDSVADAILQLSRVYSSMGNLCLEGGLSQEAIRFYRKFISINHGSTAADTISKKLQLLTSNQGEAASINEEEEYEHISDVAPDFYTITLAELYIRQGYLQMAVDVLSEILKKDADNHLAVERLNEVKAMLKTNSHKEEVIQELTRWLKNIDRMRCYAF
jgi:tetratricopeptide (TPR) repeat protein